MSINPSKARKKPVEIEVVQYKPGQYTKGEWLQWCPDANIGTKGARYEDSLDEVDFIWFKIPTLEGDHEVVDFAWVAKGVKGEFYPIRDDIFGETYTLTEVEGVKVISFDPRVVS